jgi:hypothetical protein
VLAQLEMPFRQLRNLFPPLDPAFAEVLPEYIIRRN